MQKIVIVGAYGGVGTALCRRLRAEGASLFLVGRDETKLSRLAEELDAPFQVADAAQFTDVEHAFDTAVDALGSIDGVVNCCGSLLLKPAHLTSFEDLQSTISANLNTAFAVLRSAATRMSGGSIVLISTAAARIGLANHEAIAASKAAVEGLALAAAATYANKKLRVNVVAPGLTDTPLSKRITENESARKFSLSMHALGRLGEAEDIAAAIRWLLSQESAWVTGQVLAVDGGLSRVVPK